MNSVTSTNSSQSAAEIFSAIVHLRISRGKHSGHTLPTGDKDPYIPPSIKDGVKSQMPPTYLGDHQWSGTK